MDDIYRDISVSLGSWTLRSELIYRRFIFSQCWFNLLVWSLTPELQLSKEVSEKIHILALYHNVVQYMYFRKRQTLVYKTKIWLQTDNRRHWAYYCVFILSATVKYDTAIQKFSLNWKVILRCIPFRIHHFFFYPGWFDKIVTCSEKHLLNCIWTCFILFLYFVYFTLG